MRKRAYLGVEIGNSRIKIAEVSKEKLLTNFVIEDLPENMVHENQIIAWDAMADLIRSIVRKNGFRTKHVCLVIPDNVIYMRRSLLPLMSASQLATNLPYEFHDFITDNKDDYIYDYSMVELVKDADGNETEMDLLAVAASKILMNNYIAMFKRAGLHLDIAAPQSLAVQQLFNVLTGGHSDQDYAILDLGYDTSRVSIYTEGIYSVTRSIETGVKDIIRVAADELNCDPHIAAMYLRENKNHIQEHERVVDCYSQIAIDVMRAINYYTFENRDNTLECLYYCGGGAMIAPLVAEIRDTIQLEFVPLNQFANEEINDEIALETGPAAIGICWNE